MAVNNSVKPMGQLTVFNRGVRSNDNTSAGQTNAAAIQGAAQGALIGAAQTQEPAPRRNSKVWLNVGYMTQIPNPDAPGEMMEELVSLPSNIAIDTMRKREYPWNFDTQGRPREYRKPLSIAQKEMKDMIDASNLLLEVLQAASERMEGGTSQVMPEFSIVMQKLYDEEQAEDDTPAPTSSRMGQISALFTGAAGGTGAADGADADDHGDEEEVAKPAPKSRGNKANA